MTTRRVALRTAPLISLAALLIAGGCAQQSGERLDRELRAQPTPRTGSATAPVPTPNTRILATLGGEGISAQDMHSRLAEVGGRIVLEEILIEKLAAQACADRGIEVTQAMLAEERERVWQAFIRQGVAGDEQSAERLMREVRRSRGLGPARMEGLLRRSAMLRALVADQVVVSEGSLRLAHALRYGARVEWRIITTSSLEEANAAVRRLRGGEPFGEVAADLSTDPSAMRGGVVEPIHLEDPSYPEAVRDALTRLEEGAVSNAIAIETGFAIVLREGMTEVPVAPTPAFEAVRDELAADARLQQERLLMDRLARRLLSGAQIRVIDPALGWAWEGEAGSR